MTELPLQGEGLAVETAREMSPEELIASYNARREEFDRLSLYPQLAVDRARADLYWRVEKWCLNQGINPAPLLAALQAEPSPETVERVAEGS